MGHGLTRTVGAELRAAMKSDPVEGSTERAWLGGLLIIAFLLFYLRDWDNKAVNSSCFQSCLKQIDHLLTS